jgi:cell division protein FtsN
MPSRKEAFLTVLIMVIIISATVVIFTKFGNFGIAQGQVNDTSSSSLTPEQKDAICNPNNPSSNLNPVNTTESKICGIPKTVKPPMSNTTTTTTPDTTITTETEGEPSPDTSIAPSAVP